MDARDVVAQRVTTLDGLLADPSGPFAGGGGPLAERLAEGWRAERRLLRRILDESRGADVRATIGLWTERTGAFLERSAEGDASWQDRDGHVWDAADVLRILEDLTRRIDTWLAEDGRAAAEPRPAAGAAAPADRLGERAAASAPAPAPAGAADDDDALVEALADDDDDEDDDGRYVRVNDPASRP